MYLDVKVQISRFIVLDSICSTDSTAYHKWTLTAGPSCLSATTNYMHVPHPLCYRQHTVTGDVHTNSRSCCWRYRSFPIVCLLSVKGLIGLKLAVIRVQC